MLVCVCVVEEVLRLVRDVAASDLCAVGDLCTLEANQPFSPLSSAPQEDIQCKCTTMRCKKCIMNILCSPQCTVSVKSETRKER